MPAYAAFQRGHYKTALTIATQRVEQNDDVKAMALLGELYASGLGVKQDDTKAAEWYRRAADRGDREAMFALAMLRMAGRAGPVNRDEAAKLLAAAARLKHPMASYNLAMLYLEGQLFPQDFARAAELFRVAAEAGSPEAQYALATLYKEGRGVKRDIVESDAAALPRGDCRQHRRAGRVCDRAVQRLRRRQGRGRRRPLPAARRAPRQPDRAEPPGPCPGGRARDARRPGGGDQVAPDLQGGRRQRPEARRLHAHAEAETVAAATKAAQPSIEALRLAREPRS